MTTQPRPAPARDDPAARSLDEYVEALMARCRPLEQWQRDTIAALLRPARRHLRRQSATARRVAHTSIPIAGEGQ